MRVAFSNSSLDARVRETLVATLYAHPGNLAIGAITGIFTSGTAAYLAQQPNITKTACILAFIACSRVVMAVFLPRLTGLNASRLETLYELGAFSYALFLGLIAAESIYFDAPSGVQLLMGINAVGYGPGIAARNAGRPVIAIGQMVLCFSPVIVALLMHGGLPFQVLAG